MPNEYDAWLESFTTQFVDVHGIKTAIYSAPPTDAKLLSVLFIHGINGDYHGLVPPAYEMRDVCRAIFVDLPGHGGTAIPEGADIIQIMRNWSRGLLEALHENGFEVTLSVGHSFGAYVAQETGAKLVALLNPPFSSSPLSRRGTAIIVRTSLILGGAYNSYPAMVRRGYWLMHRRTKKIDAIIKWSSALTHITKEQFKFQTLFAAAASVQKLMDISKLARMPKLLVLVSKYDRIVDNSSACLDRLPNARIIILPTDHVSVTEMPERVAEEIKQLF